MDGSICSQKEEDQEDVAATSHQQWWFAREINVDAAVVAVFYQKCMVFSQL